MLFCCVLSDTKRVPCGKKGEGDIHGFRPTGASDEDDDDGGDGDDKDGGDDDAEKAESAGSNISPPSINCLIVAVFASAPVFACFH